MYRRRFVICSLLLCWCVIARPAWAEDDVSEEAWTPSPASAAFRSLFLPGWGQAYVNRPLKAVIYGGIEQALILSIYRKHRLYNYYDRRDEGNFAGAHKEDRNRLSWYLAGAIIMSMADAYVDAHLYNFDVSDDFSSTPTDSPESAFYLGRIKVTFSWIIE